MWNVLKSVLRTPEAKAPDDLIPARDALDAHDLPRAREILDAAELLAPSGMDGLRYLVDLSRLWRRAREPGRAKLVLERAIGMSPNPEMRTEIDLALTRTLAELGALDEAKALGETLLVAAPIAKSLERARAIVALAEAIVATEPSRLLTLADDSLPALLVFHHADVADLLVLRAFARAVAGEWPSLLGAEIQGLDEAVFTRIADAAITRSTRVDPEAAVAVLSEIRDQIIVRNAYDPCLPRLVEALGNTARTAGAHDVAADAWDWLLVTHDNRGREKDAHAALLELCASFCDADRFDDAERRYQEALVRARGLGAATIARTHRELGLFEAARGDLKKAQEHLGRAIDLADPIAKAEAQIALGALLLESDATRARALLEQGAVALPADHPDAMFAREQLAGG